MIIFHYFFSFSFCFPFFCKTRTRLPRTLRDKKGLFGTSLHLHVPYLTFYLPPYVTSLTSGTYLPTEPPLNLPTSSTSTHRHSGLALLSLLPGLVRPIDQISPVESHRFHRPHLSVKSCHLPYLEKILNSFPHTWYLWSFILHPKSKSF